jgi:hypothetical protein
MFSPFLDGDICGTSSLTPTGEGNVGGLRSGDMPVACHL